VSQNQSQTEPEPHADGSRIRIRRQHQQSSLAAESQPTRRCPQVQRRRGCNGGGRGGETTQLGVAGTVHR
jgi:hypothetical protein